MADLQITLETVDSGTPTGVTAHNTRMITWTIDTVPQYELILNADTALSDVDVAQQMRNLLTANGKTWDTESPINVIS